MNNATTIAVPPLSRTRERGRGRGCLQIALYLLAVVALSGCALFSEPKPTEAAQADPRDAIYTAMATCATAIERIATGAAGDTASKVVAVGAIERMCSGGQAGHLATLAAPQQQQGLGATLWQAALQTADLLLRGYGIRTQRDVAVTQSNNAAATTIASYGAFQGIATSGFNSNAAIAGFIQAPAANITNTISGAGVIGNGTYTGPVTTNTTTTTARNCAGGQAGNSGGTAGGAGGAGGGANC